MKFSFILYVNRSGSTFLANELSKIKEILVCPEAEVLVNSLVRNPYKTINKLEKIELIRKYNTDPKLKYWNLNYDQLITTDLNRLDLFFKLLKEYQQSHKPKASIIVFKAVLLMQYTDLLLEYAKQKGHQISFIILIRDPRAIFNSQSRTYIQRKNEWMNRNPLESLYQWKYLVSVYKKNLTSSYFIMIRYEELVVDLSEIIYNILGFLGIRNPVYYPTRKGDLVLRIPEDQLSMHKNIKAPPLPERVSDWMHELSQHKQYLLQNISESELKYLGYRIYPKTKKSVLVHLLWIKFKGELILKTIYKNIK